MVALGLGSDLANAQVPPKYDHVVVVIFENHSYADIIGILLHRTSTRWLRRARVSCLHLMIQQASCPVHTR